MNWEPLIPSVAGGLITGTFAITAQIVATSRTYNNNARLARNQNQKRINAILQAIRYEFELACDIYYRKAGKQLEALPDGKPYKTYFSMPDKWLIVYPNHTEIVGQIGDKELCRAIIETYTKANYVLDGMKVNNWYLDRLAEYEKRVSQNFTDTHASIGRQDYEQHLTAFAPGLKEGNQKLKEWRDTLSEKIDKYLASHQPES